MEILRASSVGGAAAALAADSRARFLGGGTLLVRAVNSGDLSISTLILADHADLDAIRVADGRVEIGAGVTMAKILASRDLAFLHDVAGEIGGPAIRAMATVGGNLFAPSPYGDFATALLALDANVATENGKRAEGIGLEAFLKDRDATAGRIVRSVSFALPAKGAFRFVKVARRHPHGASVLSIAALVPIEGGRVKGARVAYGAMAPTPIRARGVEKALEGKALDASTIAAAVAIATEGTDPPTDPFASAWYRANVLPVHLARLLKR